MKITQDNYEQFFLDHAEGNLSTEMEKELSYFLEANPDLKAVLEDFDPSPMQTGEMHNEIPKAGLKKHLHLTDHIREDNIDQWMIRDIEDLLNDAEENELREFLALNPAYSFDYKIFGYTKVSPDQSVTYRRKKELKKKVVLFPIRRLAWLLPAAAAVILLFIGVRSFMKPEILPSRPVSFPIAEIPMFSSPGIKASSAVPAMVQKGTLSPGSNPGRITPISAKGLILFNPTETASLYVSNFDFSPITTVEKKDPSLFAKVFNNMIAKARVGIGNRTNLEKARNADFNIWSIAKAGINGYNSISGSELELCVRKDEDGKVKSYALVDEERLILSKKLNKN
jgi:hypothetical protein